MRLLKAGITWLFFVQHGDCWSDLGHRTVAYVAEKYLTKENANFFASILANDRGWDISDAAVWADTIKRGKNAREYTKIWHYIDAIDTPPKQCNVNFKRDCINAEHPGGCVISAINNQTFLFTSPRASPVVRKEALMFILHFIGDLHQPLHVEDAYTGGNDIKTCFRHACSGVELHAIWDKYILHKMRGLANSVSNDVEKQAAADWADELYKGNQKREIQKQCADVTNPQKCTMAWAVEANQYNCKYVLNVGGLTSLEDIKQWFEGRDLSTDYYDGAAPIVEYLIGIAGARLGGYLNALALASKRSAISAGQMPLGSFDL